MAIKTVQIIIDGVATNLTYNNETKKYEGNIIAPDKSSYRYPGHYYPVIVNATDVVGNLVSKDDTDSELGASLRLIVKEKEPPVISIEYPSESASIINNQPCILWNVIDNDSGVDPNTITITINSEKIIGNNIIKEEITGGYSCSYTPTSPLKDGSNTIKIDASDYDGNSATTKIVTFKIDTVPPELSITTPEDGIYTNSKKIMVSGITNDITSNPISLSIKVNSGESINVEISINGEFSQEVELNEGENVITIIATDNAGKTTMIIRNIILDTKSPVIQSVVISPNPADTESEMLVSVEVTD